MRSFLALGLSALALCSLTSPAVFAQSHCQPTLGQPVSPMLSVCGDKLALGNSATLLFTGGPPSQPAELIMGPASNPVPHAGGTLWPYPPTVTAITLDETGSFTMEIPGGGGPATIVAQITYLDDSLPPPFVGFSNAVQIYLLPDDRPVIKMVFALPIYPDSAPPVPLRTEAEAETMAQALKQTFYDNCYDQFELDIQIATPFTMPKPTTAYTSNVAYEILRDVKQGLELSEPELLDGMDYLVVHSKKVWGTNPAAGTQGMGGFNGKYVVLQGKPAKPIETIAQHLMFHELGHTWGLNHCGAKAVGSKLVEYGHPYDPMGGNAQDPLHFNGWSKLQMGWIPTENVLEVGLDTPAGTMVHLLPINSPACAVPGGGIALIVFRHSTDPTARNWLIYNHVDPQDDPQALTVRIPYTETSPTLLTGSYAFASGDNSILRDQSPSNSILEAGIPVGSSFQTPDVTIENVGELANDEIVLRIIPADTALGYAENRVPNFVLTHSQAELLFVSGPVEFTALDVLPPAGSTITSFEFEIFVGGDDLEKWLRGLVGKPEGLLVADSGPLLPGAYPGSPEPGSFRWTYDTTTTLANQGYVVVASAHSANGTALRKRPIMVDNSTP